MRKLIVLSLKSFFDSLNYRLAEVVVQMFLVDVFVMILNISDIISCGFEM